MPVPKSTGEGTGSMGNVLARQNAKREVNAIMDHHAQISFGKLDKARIIFTYASFLEYQRELEIAQSVSANPQHVAFIKVTGSIVMALVKFKLPPSAYGAWGSSFLGMRRSLRLGSIHLISAV